jgi:two-component system cell cycle response regulator
LESNRRKRILCVDESEQIRNYVRQLLQTHGYQCDCYPEVASLYEQVKSGDCDLVLLDLHLPSRASYEFLERMRHEGRTASIAKVGTTGFGARRDLLNAFQLGVDDFIRKPFYAEELLARIDHLLRVKETENRLKAIATIDPLTELHNRGEIARRFATEVSRARRDGRDVGVMMFDIDHFKRVNDTYGHPLGDHVLRRVAQALHDSLRVTDVLGRYGGEEFVAILPKATHSGVMLLGERLRVRVEELEFAVDGKSIDVSVSIGACIWPHELLQPEMTLEDCVRPADQALYEAKRSGRNRVVFRDPPRLAVTRPPSSFRGMGRSIPAPSSSM